MAVIAVVGGPGAPGATTTALALLLAWPLQPGRRIVLVEADPDGGAVLAGALEGRVEAVYGLRNLAVADRRGLLAQTIWEQLIDLSPEGNAERLLLPGLTDPAQASGLTYTWEPLAELLHGIEQQGYDVIVDLGRSGATGTSAVLARRADAVAVTVRSTLRGLSAARPRLAALGEDLAAAGTGTDALGLLLVAEGPYSGAEVSREFGLPLLGVLPHAPRTARVLSDGGDTTDRRFIRSELMRTARSAADEVQLLVRRRRERLAPGATAGAAAPGAPVAPGGSGGPVPVAAPVPVGPVPVGPVAPVPPAPPVPVPAPYGQGVHGQSAYGEGQGQPSFAQSGYGQPGYAQSSHTQPGYPQPGYPQPGHAQPGHAQRGYGPTAQGPGEGEPPSYVPPVITTGPVAPLAGLAPQPAAPAPFPVHVQSAGHASGQASGHGSGPEGEDDQYQLRQPTVTNRQDDDQYPYNPGEVLRAR
ncbi:hypothetical protein ACFWIQ_15020 [Kitasatospora sp. NPDC127059]|uniref:hypothetical protein n=1 Tax=unclassified Kitasatospora TaxID=2633591 RepID=UPI00364B045F